VKIEFPGCRDARETTDIGFAAVLFYLKYPLARISTGLGPESTSFVFAVPELDWDDLAKDYEAGKLVLADARMFSVAHCSLVARVREVQRRGGVVTYWQQTKRPDRKLERRPVKHA
jgi:hypothetical protein